MYPQKSALIRNGSVSPVRADMMRIIRFVPDYFRIISGLFADYFRIFSGLFPDYLRISGLSRAAASASSRAPA